MENQHRFKKEIGPENVIFIVIFFGLFIALGNKMGGTNMIMTIINTSYRLLIDVCFYIMAMSVIAGAVSSIFSEFGFISTVHKLLSVFVKPLYGLPGAASLGILNCYLSDNPSILTLANEDNFLSYFKKYQLPALTNLGTSFGMGLIVTTTMMGLPVKGAVGAALIGNLGAVVGSIVSVRLMLSFTKKTYGTTETVEVKGGDKIPDNMRKVREGGIFSRLFEALLEGGQSGVQMGMAIIPGVLIICSIVMILTHGPGAQGLYTGAEYEGIPFLPWVGEKIAPIMKPLFGFSSYEAISVPITALGSSGAALGVIKRMSEMGNVTANDIAVFTAICMCWSGYLSTHIAMMDALRTRELTSKAIFSHTIGGICAGIAAHLFFLFF